MDDSIGKTDVMCSYYFNTNLFLSFCIKIIKERCVCESLTAFLYVLKFRRWMEHTLYEIHRGVGLDETYLFINIED